MKLSLFFPTLWLLAALTACGPGVGPDTPPTPPTPPDPADTTSHKDTVKKKDLKTPIPKTGYKIATLWIDLSANISRLSTKQKALSYLDKIQDCGFNAIVLDVKGVSGAVMYDSDFLYKVQTLNSVDISQMDYDYPSFFIEECKKRNMRITISTCIMPYDDPRYQSDPEWTDLYATEFLPKGMVDIRNDNASEVFSFLNPCLDKSKAIAKRIAGEIAGKFKDIDGYCLDYCRYMDYNSDFSEATHKAMEEYYKETIDDWPTCVYSWPAGSKDGERTSYTAGPYYKKFCEFKAATIKSIVKSIRDTVKAVNPNLELEYWASAWWPLPGTGQNWASPDLNRTTGYWWSTDKYYLTGFAKYLDIFQLGAYTQTLYGTGTESIQGLITQGKSLIRKNCKMYGTISAAVPPSFKMADACYMCLSDTDGLMVFDLSHVAGQGWWVEIKKGIMKYRNEFENN